MPSTFEDRIDNLTTSVAVKFPVRVATTAPITALGLQTIDGIALADQDRVLVMHQTDAASNGVYIASASSTTPWQRAQDFDGPRDAVDGTLLYVREGTANGNQIWRTICSDFPIVFNASDITFEDYFRNLGFSEAMLPVFMASSTTEALELLGVSPAMFPVVNAATTDLALAQMAITAFMISLLKQATAASAVQALGLRTQLTVNTIYYASPTGNDGNDGLDPSRPKTFSGAVSFAHDNIDTRGQTVLIQLANGTYVDPQISVQSPIFGISTIVISGDDATPSNVVIQVAAGHVGVFAKDQGGVTIHGVTFTSSGAGAVALQAGQFGILDFFACIFEGFPAGIHINVVPYGSVNANGAYAITGGAAAHINNTGGNIDYQAIVTLAETITVTGAPAWSVAAIVASGGRTSFPPGSVSGSGTGIIFTAVNGASIESLDGTDMNTCIIGNALGTIGVLGGSTGTTFSPGTLADGNHLLGTSQSVEGAMIYVANGRKAGEGAGAGTGVMAYFSAANWLRLSDDTIVTV